MHVVDAGMEHTHLYGHVYMDPCHAQLGVQSTEPHMSHVHERRKPMCTEHEHKNAHIRCAGLGTPTAGAHAGKEGGCVRCA
jgi:hypothetical protein